MDEDEIRKSRARVKRAARVMHEAGIRETLDRWDKSGAIKTSLYYRLLDSLLSPKPLKKEKGKNGLRS